MNFWVVWPKQLADFYERAIPATNCSVNFGSVRLDKNDRCTPDWERLGVETALQDTERYGNNAIFQNDYR